MVHTPFSGGRVFLVVQSQFLDVWFNVVETKARKSHPFAIEPRIVYVAKISPADRQFYSRKTYLFRSLIGRNVLIDPSPYCPNQVCCPSAPFHLTSSSTTHLKHTYRLKVTVRNKTRCSQQTKKKKLQYKFVRDRNIRVRHRTVHIFMG